MRHIARLVPAIVFVIGLFVAIRQLSAVDTAAGHIALTGAYVVGGVLLLFVLIIGVGKGLGRFVNRDDDVEDDGK